jgi:hypothetical protein
MMDNSVIKRETDSCGDRRQTQAREKELKTRGELKERERGN